MQLRGLLMALLDFSVIYTRYQPHGYKSAFSGIKPSVDVDDAELRLARSSSTTQLDPK